MEPSKAQKNNWRRTIDPAEGCHTCTEVQTVPWLWCDHAGRTTCTGMICDRHNRRPS